MVVFLVELALLFFIQLEVMQISGASSTSNLLFNFGKVVHLGDLRGI